MVHKTAECWFSFLRFADCKPSTPDEETSSSSYISSTDISTISSVPETTSQEFESTTVGESRDSTYTFSSSKTASDTTFLTDLNVTTNNELTHISTILSFDSTSINVVHSTLSTSASNANTNAANEKTVGISNPSLNSLTDEEWIAVVLAVVSFAAIAYIALICYFKRNYVRKTLSEYEQTESDETNSKMSSSVKLKDISEACNFAFEPESTYKVGNSIYEEVSLSNVDEITKPTQNYEEVQLMKTLSSSTKSSTKDLALPTPKAEKESILDEIYQLAAEVEISQTATDFKTDCKKPAQNENLKDLTEAREISETTVNILYEEYRSESIDTPKSITGEKNDSTTSGKDPKATLDILACTCHNDHKDDAYANNKKATDSSCENIEKATDSFNENIEKATDPSFENIEKVTDSSNESIGKAITDHSYKNIDKATDPSYENIEKAANSSFENIEKVTDFSFKNIKKATKSSNEAIEKATDSSYENIKKAIDISFKNIEKAIDSSCENVEKATDEKILLK